MAQGPIPFRRGPNLRGPFCMGDTRNKGAGAHDGVVQISIRPQLAGIERMGAEYGEVDDFDVVVPAGAVGCLGAAMMRQQAFAQAVAMIVESNQAIGDVYVAARHTAFGNDPFGVKSGRGALGKIDTGRDVAGAVAEKDAVGQGPAPHHVLLDAGFEPVHR